MVMEEVELFLYLCINGLCMASHFASTTKLLAGLACTRQHFGRNDQRRLHQIIIKL